MTAISIVTITFNDPEGLERTLKSIASQSFRDFETIVIDGGSNYDVLQLAAQYDCNLSFICSEKDRGIAHAFNKGTERATGALVNYLNSGDSFVDPDVLSRVWESYERHRWVWAFGLRRRVRASGEVVPPGKKETGTPRLSDFLRGRFLISHQGSFFSRDALTKLKGYDEAHQFHAMDIDLMLRFWKLAEPFPLARELVLYDGTGISARQFVRTAYRKAKICSSHASGVNERLLIWAGFTWTVAIGKLKHGVRAIVGDAAIRSLRKWVGVIRPRAA